MIVEVPEIEQLKAAVDVLIAEVAALRLAVRPERAWYTLKEACQLKGVVFNTIKNNRHLQPAHGHSVLVGKCKRYPAAVVHEWLLMTDEQLTREIVRKKSA